MRALLPYLALYKRHKWMLSLGIVLAIVTLLASIGLLTLSGWFLSASAVAGVAGLYSFNYMLPAAGVRGAAITRTAGRYFERLVSHDATFRVLQHLRIYTFSKLLPLSPAGLLASLCQSLPCPGSPLLEGGRTQLPSACSALQQLSVLALQNPAAPHLTRWLSLGVLASKPVCTSESVSWVFDL